MATLATGVQWGTQTPAIYFNVSYTASRSGANMQYTVNVDFQALSSNYGRYFGYPIYLDLSLDGVSKVSHATVKNPNPPNWGTGEVFYHSSTFSVAKTTGTVTLTLKIYSGEGSSRSQTYSYSLPVSPAASVLSLPSAGFTIGSSGSVSITRYDSSFKDIVTYSVGSATGQITEISSGGSTSFSWTPDTTLYAQMGGATTKAGTITVTTKSGTTTVGTNTYTFTLKGSAPSSLTLPSSFTVNTAGTITVTRNNSGFTDTITYTLGGASGQIGDPISSGGSTTRSWTPSKNLYLQMVGQSSKTGTMKITTKIGTTTVGSRSYTFTLNAGSVYNLPKVTVTYERGTGTSASNFVPDPSGSTVHAIVTITTSGTGNSAALVVKIDGTQKTSVSGQTNGAKNFYYTNIDTQTSHTLEATITDMLSKTATMKATISTEAVPMNINVDYPGVAIGKLSEKNAFEVKMSQELRGQFRIWGDILFDNVEQTGQRVVRFGNASGSTNHHDAAIVGGNPSTETGLGAYDFVNSAWIWQYKTGTQKLSLKDDGQMSLTYTSNTYVSSSSFGYVSAYRRSNVYLIRGNLEVTTAIPTGTNWTQIGTIGNFSGAYTEYLSVAAQNGSGVLAVRIESNGTISIANTGTSAVSGLCRFSSAIPVA